MKILIDILHPAHVHVFKQFAWEMIKKNHQVYFTVMEKEMSVYLLKSYNFNFTVLGKNQKSIFKKIITFFFYFWKLLFISLKNHFDVFISHGSIYTAPVSFLLRKPHLVFEDTENASVNNMLCHLFTKTIITGNSYKNDLGNKQIIYEGNLELCYLHSKYFKSDPQILKFLNVKKNEKFSIIRFVGWNASHDIGHSGIDFKNKIKIVKEFSRFGKVFISSEGELPEELKPYQIKIPLEKIHDALAFATLYFGESATMASECAMLGTPAIYVNSITTGYLDEQEKYGLIYSFRSLHGVLEKALELLNMPHLKKVHLDRRKKMLAEKIDVTAFMVWFVKNYPKSAVIMKKNPDYQKRFK